MKQASAQGLAWHKENGVTIPHHVEETLITLADLVAKARAPVQRDGYSRDVVASPQPEGPGRLAKQLRQLLVGLCIVHGKHEPGEEELAILRKVARDTMPPFRAAILEALAKEQALTLAEVQKAAAPARDSESPA